ncbi:hypothetical protein HO133_001483 [Letharia lupina]|uniref:Uncharacterized protein n=1 Tax=Letharia lupina TaxID=560253 RepID=A0A8H6FBK5_9LECA|nr:uncharacterized protein HO133_001483 [Letharia lupina]KAF6222397.1 hypothetical protein HO133_001483 [Letharia lupina]
MAPDTRNRRLGSCRSRWRFRPDNHEQPPREARTSLDRPWEDPVLSLASISASKVSKFAQFFSKLPLFSSNADWLMHASIIEGYLFYPQLKRGRLDMFPRTDMAKDEYLEYTPSTWTLSNNHQPSPMDARFLWSGRVRTVRGLFVDVADLYGQIHVARDIASRMRRRA